MPSIMFSEKYFSGDDYTPPLRFPTAEEIEFLNKYCTLSSSDIQLVPTDGALSLQPIRFSMKDMTSMCRIVLFHDGFAHVLDILIRIALEKAGANLATTQYSVNIRFPGHVHRIGFSHETYENANGHAILDLMGERIPNGQEVPIDTTPIELSMKIFVR